MKSLLFAFVLCSCASALSAATVEPLITRSYVNTDRVELTLANLEQERTTVKLTDLSSSEVFFKDRIKDHNGYGISLCLTEVPDGRYVLTVEKGDTVRRQVILKNEKGIMCSDWK